MEFTDLTIFLALILALSIASERLIEMAKGFLFKSLNVKKTDETAEQKRHAYQHLLGLIAGIVTAFIASWAMPENEYLHGDTLPKGLRILSIGLLVSGGSGLWNSMLTYLLKIKDLKEAQTKKLDRT